MVYAMSKMYVKDSNGKYKLVEKDRDQKEETKKVSQKSDKPLSLEELDARLRFIEAIVLDPRK